MAGPALRILRGTTIGAGSILLGLFLLVQLQQRLLQHRAERLHKQILALQLHPGTFADIQQMQREWGTFGHYNGECTARHCYYDITITDTFSQLAYSHNRMPPVGVMELGTLLGDRSSFVLAELRETGNHLWGAGFGIGIQLNYPDVAEDDPFRLEAGFRSGPKLLQYGSLDQAALLRGYEIGEPGRCMLCQSLHVHMTAQTSEADVLALSKINFSCLTRHHPCEHLNELVPEAASRLRAIKNEAPDFSHCASIPARAREADGVLVVRVEQTSLDVSRDPASPYEIANVSVLETVKPSARHRVDTPVTAALEHLEPFRAGSRPTLIPGERYLLMYEEEIYSNALHLLPCSVVQLSKEARQEARQGVELDLSVGDLPSTRTPFLP